MLPCGVAGGPRGVRTAAYRYVKNNRQWMNYPEYRWMGIPVSTASIESVIKQVNYP